ncbi:hypothetical protein IAQ61_005475 [Plenodomus lingam]|uniref:uncharacterized protein n=1 Tax=Leptosphaeria maculans TaxID=5022 RepID=UPI00331AE76A|nr:hypothetical protein IAQ61_005475 [Plenodomus lingam]
MYLSLRPHATLIDAGKQVRYYTAKHSNRRSWIKSDIAHDLGALSVSGIADLAIDHVINGPRCNEVTTCITKLAPSTQHVLNS